MNKYTAIIIEPRKHNALSFVLKNFLENLNNHWNIIVFHGLTNETYIKNIVKNHLDNYKSRIQLVNLNKENLSTNEYNVLLKTKEFYNYIPTEMFLVFQVDTVIIKENKNRIYDFFEYDYVGAPWISDKVVGNGGLSLRKKSKMLEIINAIHPSTSLYNNEDEYFCRQQVIQLKVPDFEEAKKFSVETLFYHAPFGVHNCYNHLTNTQWSFLSNKYPVLQVLKEINSIPVNNDSEIFTIVYKTYTNDLEWLEYSLLSLKRYLNVSNVYEILLYTHDVSFSDVYNMTVKIQLKHFVNFRIIPIHYNYHGYIKQQVIKANCYKDCKTDFVVLLDCDLLLKKPLNLETFIKNGKIDWYYLELEDDPTRPFFSVWKKACEDSNMVEKTKHYMSNGFPFIFTRKSLEEAANKFIEMHNCDYDSYCKSRCDALEIYVPDKVRDIFYKLSQVFSEFEYLGHFCHHYSNDYIFYKTPYCKMEAQNDPNEPDSYFIQNWSHGGISDQKRKDMEKIIKMKTIILTWTTKFNNLIVDDYNNFFGIGDILRGTISMFQLSKKYNFHLKVDIQLHPISSFLKYNNHNYSDYVVENKDNIPFIYPEEIEEFIINNTNEVCCLFTNSFIIEEISDECKEFIKELLTPTEEFASYINETNLFTKAPTNFNIFHFRLGDTMLVRNKDTDTPLEYYSNILEKYYEKEDILLSDSTRFKDFIIERNHSIFLFKNQSAHLGYEKNIEKIKDTLFEFFTIIKAKKIKTFTFYHHVSGFVHMLHHIYDIPIIQIGIDNIECNTNANKKQNITTCVVPFNEDKINNTTNSTDIKEVFENGETVITITNTTVIKSNKK
jgi:hypothetical protein